MDEGRGISPGPLHFSAFLLLAAAASGQPHPRTGTNIPSLCFQKKQKSRRSETRMSAWGHGPGRSSAVMVLSVAMPHATSRV